MNLIQQALYEYIIDKDYNDKMLQYNALLDYLFEDLLVEKDKNSGPTATSLQEILTCIFFHAYFNLNQKFENVEELVNWYKSKGQKIIEKINDNGINKNSLNTFFNSGTNINKKTSYTNWQLSWYNQCKSFENSEFAQKNKTNLTFIHHDTGFTINNKKANFSNKDAGIVKRVKDGIDQFKNDIKNKLNISQVTKDNYQKADIYVITNESSNKEELFNTLGTLDQEIDDWKNNITNNFAGISLKQITKNPLKHVHMPGAEKNAYAIAKTPIKIEIPIFENASFDTLKNNLSNLKLSAYLHFGIIDTANGSTAYYVIQVRSNGVGAGGSSDEKKLNKLDDYLISGKHKFNDAADTFYTIGTLVPDKDPDGNKNEGTDANLGKVTNLIQAWLNKADDQLKAAMHKPNKSILENLFNAIQDNISKITNIKYNPFNLSSEENNNIIELINFLEENDQNGKIEKLFTKIFEYTKENNNIINRENLYEKLCYNQDIIKLLAEIITNDSWKLNKEEITSSNIKDYLYKLYYSFRWYKIAKSILTYLWIITLQLRNETDNVKGSTAITLFTSAEYSVLPYILIG